jgi:hypothetical protein
VLVPMNCARRRLVARCRSHAAFVRSWNAATDKVVKAGFEEAADTAGIKPVGEGSPVGGRPSPPLRTCASPHPASGSSIGAT